MEFNKETVSKLINNPNLTDETISFLVETAKEENYSGWDIDWEEIKEEDRDAYSNFIKKLSDALHKENLVVSVAVHAQKGSSADWVGTKGQDYTALGKYADLVRIMTYDYHNSVSNMGAISPLDEITATVRYAKKTIPLSKIVIGIPSYGYDWGKGTISAVSYKEAVDHLGGDSGYKRDSSSLELTGEYTNQSGSHTIWFQDAESMMGKISAANKLGVYQFVLWRLGNEDTAVWDKL